MPACARTSTGISASECYAYILGAVAGTDLAPCRERCLYGRAIMLTSPLCRPEQIQPLRVDTPASLPGWLQSGITKAVDAAIPLLERFCAACAKLEKPLQSAGAAAAQVKSRPQSRQGAGQTPAAHPLPPESPQHSPRLPAWLADTLAHVISRYPAADLQGLKFLRQVARASFGYEGDLEAFRAACEAAKLTISGKARPYVEINARARAVAKLGNPQSEAR